MTDTWPERLSEHWTFREAIHSRRGEELGIENQPPIELLPNAQRLVDLAESVRAFLTRTFGVEVHLETTSGYRCLKLNAAVGGSGAHAGEKLSAHTRFLAFDLIPAEIGVTAAFDALKKSTLAFDKLIWETDGATAWIHLQAAPPGHTARRLVFTGVKSHSGSTFRAAT